MRFFDKFLNQPVLVLLIGLLIFILGIIASNNIPLEAVPEIEVPYAMVTTTYPGAAPEEIENIIIKPLEEKLIELKELDVIRMYALQGMAFSWLQFLPDSDTEESIDALREKLIEAEKTFPKNVETPIITEMDFSALPILILNLFGDFTISELTRYGEQFKEEIEKISGVNEIEIFGDVSKEIKVLIDPDKLQVLQIPISQVVGAIKQNNLNMPAGNITLDGQDLLIRTKGKFNNIDDLAEIIVSIGANGTITKLKDLAQIIDKHQEPNTFSRYNTQNSITLLIGKRYGENILDVTYEIEKVVDKMKSTFPSNLYYDYSARQATDIERQFSQLKQNAMWGGLFVILTLFFGIGFRNSFIVAFAIPFSIFTAFLLMYLTGMPQTGIAMFAMIMVMGIVVDGAIIVAESTYRRIEMGMERTDAAKEAIGKVGGPILTALFTSMAAFAPLMYMKGIMGQFLSVIPQVVIFALIGAAIADHILIPVLTSQFMTLSKNTGHLSGNWWGMRVYDKMIKWAMKNRKKTMLIAFMSFMSGLLIIMFSFFSDYKLIKIQAFPRVPKPRIIIDISSSPGSDLHHTNEMTFQIEKIIEQIPEVETFVTTVGETGVQNIRLSQGGAIGNEVAQINVDLVHKKNRNKSVEEIVEMLNSQLIGNWPGVDIKIGMIQEGPPVSDKLVIDLQGDQMDELEIFSSEIKKLVQQIPGTRNVTTSMGKKRNEIQVNVNHERSNLLGISVENISMAVSFAMHGLEISKLMNETEDIPITFKFDVEGDEAVEKIKNIQLKSFYGNMVSLSDVADVEIQPSQSIIYRKKYKRTISVSTDIDEMVDASDIKRKLNKKMKDIIIPSGINVEYGGITDEAQESFRDLGKSMLIAFIVILILLSAQFRSVMQPFIIACTIPLAFVGVILGLMITRVPFGLMAFFGLVALTGVVVNDAIVLISHINDLRREGMLYDEAIIQGGKNRLRPIILTTVTTISGMIPLTLDFAGGAEYWRPLAISIIFGLAMATILTLVVVPVLYSLIVRNNDLIST